MSFDVRAATPDQALAKYRVHILPSVLFNMRRSTLPGWALFFLLISLSGLFRGPEAISAYAFPHGDDQSDDHGASISFNASHLERRQDAKVPLRILALGASITWGVGSSNGNGFRKPLRDALRYDGWEVNMVGSRRGGTMIDWDNEGTPGALIHELRDHFKKSAGYKANVVVINCGTNDAIQARDLANAGSRMADVLNDIWATSGMENTCVMLSTLVPAGTSSWNTNRILINAQYRAQVSRLSSAGRCVYLADMDPVGTGNGWMSLSSDIGSDGIHPTDQGFLKMGYVFYKAITKAAAAGHLRAPATISSGIATGCAKVLGRGIYAGGLTQKGSGDDDGIYYHNSVSMGIVLTHTSEWDRDQWRFARLYGRQYDDFVGWYEPEPGSHRFVVYRNTGAGKFVRISDMNPDLKCIPKGVRFIDMNADGYDDLVCIAPDGSAYLSINQRDGTATKPPTFKRVSATAFIKGTEGFAQERVILADIDGDGRGDYCILDDGGNVQCWRNGWVNDIPAYWQPLGIRFTAKGMGDGRGVRFEDINGDGRDDWIWVSDTGATTTWTNSRSCQDGKLGDGLNVAWRQGFFTGKSSGPTHSGLSSFASSGLRGRVHFGRIFGEPQDFGLLGRADYIFLEHTDLPDGKHRFDMRVWKNIGFGGTKLKADGNKYCNMKGHKDGREDYVWVHSKGSMRVYPNRGVTHIAGDESFWEVVEQMWEPTAYVGKSLDRRDLHLADWDGDGACDIIWVNPDNGNRPSVWLNKYPITGRWTWDYYADPPTARAANVNCAQKRGLGIHDLSVRFADVTGNGRDDFLCIENDGRVTGYLHRDDNTWENAGQIKFAEGHDRANLRWADVNGDGRDDMLWIDKFNGNAVVYYNRGRADPAQTSGSSISWGKTSGPVYDGNRAGTCIYYPDLDGNGRADMHSLMGTFDNRAETWYNPSCGLTDREGDDPGGVSNPNLPVQPADPDPGPGGGDTGGGGGQPYYPNPGEDEPLPACEGKYETIDELRNDIGLIPLHCGPQYILPILQGILRKSKEKYDKIMADGYDKSFSIYAKYSASIAGERLFSFLKENGDKFFTCQVVEEVTCCPVCEYEGKDCRYCTNDSDICIPDRPWGGANSTWENKTEACPPDYSERGIGDNQWHTTTWTMREAKKRDFYDALAAETGIIEDNIRTGGNVMLPDWALDNACARQMGFGAMEPSCFRKGWWIHPPVLFNFTEDSITNPKDLVKTALDRVDEAGGDLATVAFRVASGDYVRETFAEDPVDAIAMPTFMVEESIRYMEEVVETAKEIEADKAMLFLINFLSAIFMILPVLGTTLGNMGMAQLGRVMVLVGELGGTGLAIRDVVIAENTAPLLVFSLIMSARSIRDSTRVVQAAKIRRGMTPKEVSVFSEMVARNLDATGMVSRRAAIPPMCARYA
ncbi:hypothetical protein QQX98_006578 [Neonectria punicea]|uniref:SGNH hydrolase-type esterase domain-containing protein n=1 Tax=Neonectria punicea TaxID=979145 RepID=A0ABR1H0F1_9HYPO